MKTTLHQEKHKPQIHSDTIPILKSLPFFRTHSGVYLHRVRSGRIYMREGQASHTAVKFWCGQTGFFSAKKHPRAQFFADVPDGEVICATCEGRAIGSGQLGSHQINGRIVKFSPRS